MIQALKTQSKIYKAADRDGMYVRVMPSGAIPVEVGAAATRNEVMMTILSVQCTSVNVGGEQIFQTDAAEHLRATRSDMALMISAPSCDGSMWKRQKGRLLASRARR